MQKDVRLVKDFRLGDADLQNVRLGDADLQNVRLGDADLRSSVSPRRWSAMRPAYRCLESHETVECVQAELNECWLYLLHRPPRRGGPTNADPRVG